MLHAHQRYVSLDIFLTSRSLVHFNDAYIYIYIVCVGQCERRVTQLMRGVGMTSASSMEKQLSLSTGSAAHTRADLSG